MYHIQPHQSRFSQQYSLFTIIEDILFFFISKRASTVANSFIFALVMFCLRYFVFLSLASVHKDFQNFSHNTWTKMAIIKVSTVLSTVTVLTFMLNMRTLCYKISNCFLLHWSTFCLIFVTTQELFKLYISLAKIQLLEFGA